MKTAIICVSGRIREVGYRTRVMSLAHVLGVNGYVRNLPDTRVEIVAQESEEILEEFINKIEIQDEMVHVDAVKVDYSESFEGFKDFHKIVGPNETDSRLDKAVIALNNVVTELKEFRKEAREDNQQIINEIREGNQQIIKSVQDMHQDIHNNHAELITEIRGIRDDNNERVINEIHEVKALLKTHLKQS